MLYYGCIAADFTGGMTPSVALALLMPERDYLQFSNALEKGMLGDIGGMAWFLSLYICAYGQKEVFRQQKSRDVVVDNNGG